MTEFGATAAVVGGQHYMSKEQKRWKDDST